MRFGSLRANRSDAMGFREKPCGESVGPATGQGGCCPCPVRKRPRERPGRRLISRGRPASGLRPPGGHHGRAWAGAGGRSGRSWSRSRGSTSGRWRRGSKRCPERASGQRSAPTPRDLHRPRGTRAAPTAVRPPPPGAHRCGGPGAAPRAQPPSPEHGVDTLCRLAYAQVGLPALVLLAVISSLLLATAKHCRSPEC